VYCLNSLVEEELAGWKRLQKTQACLMKGKLTSDKIYYYFVNLKELPLDSHKLALIVYFLV
jgi:hypothetical protein